jgi:hypothetical protein
MVQEEEEDAVMNLSHAEDPLWLYVHIFYICLMEYAHTARKRERAH